MTIMVEMRRNIGDAISAGKTPLRWRISADAVTRIEHLAQENGRFAHDVHGTTGRTMFGIPYEVGVPTGGVDVELICADDC